MTLTTIVLVIAIAAVLLTLLSHFGLKATASLPMSFLQHFCGAWFAFSGFVKIVDPLGTAYKMEQYFDEFASTATGAGAGFLAPVFEWGSGVSVYVATAMVVLEVVLGLLLILGESRRFTAWLFFGIMVFFTLLTGFTFLTGYVPSGENFFDFGAWGKYVETNMRVTDCGCFGDFLKLDPYTSFLKDCFLMVPAVAFVAFPGRMHQLFSKTARVAIGWTSVFAASLFAMSNFLWGLPAMDFRPFAEGKDLRTQKQAEADAAAAVEVIAYGIENRATGEYRELSFDDYLKRYKEFPESDFELTQIKTEPTVPHTKLSEFALEDADGMPMADGLLAEPGYVALVVAYKLYDDGTEEGTRAVRDSMFVVDTAADGTVSKVFAAFRERSEVANITKWDPTYVAKWREKIVPFADAAERAGWRVAAATAFTPDSRIDDFRHAVQWQHDFYKGDDILLKTIIRSNPGVVVLKDGKVVKHYHWSEVPADVETADLPLAAVE